MRVVVALIARRFASNGSCPQAVHHQFGRHHSTVRTLRHPTAIVGEGAKIGEGVSIGPFVVVSNGATIGAHCELGPGAHILGDTTLGDRCVIRSHAVIGAEVPGTTVLGRGNTVGSHAVVGSQSQDKKYAAGDACYLRVGDDNDIREHAQVHRSSSADECTTIGDGNLLQGSCHVGHDCAVGDGNTLSNHSLLAGHVTVGDKAVIGGAAAIQQFVTIGSYAFIAGGSKVDGSVPSCMRAAGDRAELRGVNVVGLRRNGFSSRRILETMNVVSQLWRPEAEEMGLGYSSASSSGSDDGGIKQHNDDTAAAGAVRLVTPDAAALLRRAESLLADVLLTSDAHSHSHSDGDGEETDLAGASEMADDAATTTTIAPAALLLRSILNTRDGGVEHNDNDSSGGGSGSGSGEGSGRRRRRAPLCLWRNTSEFDRVDVNALRERVALLEKGGGDGGTVRADDAAVAAAAAGTGAGGALSSARSAYGLFHADGRRRDDHFSSRTPGWLPEVEVLGKLRVRELQALLLGRGLPAEGLKYKLVERLNENRAAPLVVDEAAAASARRAAETAWNFMRKQLSPPLCLGHNETCLVRVVKKDGPNFGRIFFVCPRSTYPRPSPGWRNAHDCGHFSWAHNPKTKRTTTRARKDSSAGGRGAAEGGFDGHTAAAAARVAAPAAVAAVEEVEDDGSLLEEIFFKSARKRRKKKKGT